MQINKDKLNAIAKPLAVTDRQIMVNRRKDRRMHTASAAIAAKILRQMRIKGINKKTLSEELGITPANVTRYLGGKCNFELRTLVEIERILDITIIDRNVIPSKEENKIIVIEVETSKSHNEEYVTFHKGSGLYKMG